MKEVWKIIEEYPNYSVSSLGRVKRLKSSGYSIMLKPIDDGKGYRKVHLFKEGKSKLYLIHRLVAQAFIPNPDNLPYINHKDEDRANNRVENLEWCTAQYNSEYSLGKKVLQLDSEGNVVKEWESASKAAKEFGINHQVILGCCYNTTGFNWKFKE